MHKTIVVVVTVVALAAVAGVYVWSTHNRYYVVTSGGGGVYEIDRKSGQTWRIGTHKTLVTEQGTVQGPLLQDIPASDVARLTGTAGYSFSSEFFSGSIYNPTDWEIREIRVRIQGDAQSGWDRVFICAEIIGPLSSGHFRIDTGDGHLAKATRWNIVSARGYRK